MPAWELQGSGFLFALHPGSGAAGVGPGGAQEAVGTGIKQGCPLSPRWPRAHVSHFPEPAARAGHMAHPWGLQVARRPWGAQGVCGHGGRGWGGGRTSSFQLELVSDPGQMVWMLRMGVGQAQSLVGLAPSQIRRTHWGLGRVGRALLLSEAWKAGL